MANPQQPELARSRKTPSQNPDAVAGVVEGQSPPGTTGPGGPVPEDNQPGHHPPQEQDKPDLQDFAERLGTAPAGTETSGPPTGSGVGESPVAAVASAARNSGPLARAAAVFAAVAVLVGLVLTTKRRRSRS